ncbi:unnamed protein product [Mytilus edulis]|uniref:Ig-like domain-containing protein n=1 Tax=Mytilus edulis TaxID=6550 RepID=A0A8S3RXK6_MYTED|nr:unnamed protein product [Mytilus edulis]
MRKIISERTTYEDITLKCSNKHNCPYCQWQLATSPGQFVDIDASNKHKDQATTVMTIKSVNISDRGSYRCKCYDDSKTYQYSSSITIDLRTEHRLDCGQTGTDYRWKWKNRGFHVFQMRYNTSKYNINTMSQILTLLKVESENNDLNIPNIYIQRSTYNALIGNAIILECTIGQTKLQTRQVLWTRLISDHEINVTGSDSKKYQEGTLQNPNLKISNLDYRDSGEYRCNGWNRNGQNYGVTLLTTGYMLQTCMTELDSRLVDFPGNVSGEKKES